MNISDIFPSGPGPFKCHHLLNITLLQATAMSGPSKRATAPQRCSEKPSLSIEKKTHEPWGWGSCRVQSSERKRVDLRLLSQKAHMLRCLLYGALDGFCSPAPGSAPFSKMLGGCIPVSSAALSACILITSTPACLPQAGGLPSSCGVSCYSKS